MNTGLSIKNLLVIEHFLDNNGTEAYAQLAHWPNNFQRMQILKDWMKQQAFRDRFIIVVNYYPNIGIAQLKEINLSQEKLNSLAIYYSKFYSHLRYSKEFTIAAARMGRLVTKFTGKLGTYPRNLYILLRGGPWGALERLDSDENFMTILHAIRQGYKNMIVFYCFPIFLLFGFLPYFDFVSITKCENGNERWIILRRRDQIKSFITALRQYSQEAAGIPFAVLIRKKCDGNLTNSQSVNPIYNNQNNINQYITIQNTYNKNTYDYVRAPTLSLLTSTLPLQKWWGMLSFLWL
ncbi:hypothetical protein ACJX0J_038925, partial [Zea mays]